MGQSACLSACLPVAPDRVTKWCGWAKSGRRTEERERERGSDAPLQGGIDGQPRPDTNLFENGIQSIAVSLTWAAMEGFPPLKAASSSLLCRLCRLNLVIWTR